MRQLAEHTVEVLFGGAPMDKDIGSSLVAAGVNIIPVWGAYVPRVRINHHQNSLDLAELSLALRLQSNGLRTQLTGNISNFETVATTSGSMFLGRGFLKS